MLSTVKHQVYTRYQQWLNKRLPPQRSVILNQKRVFIFPAKAGRWFLLALMVMLLAAINYQNNMVFAQFFLLLGVFVVAILHTFANLSGLTVTALKSSPVFAGEQAELKLLLSRQGRKEYFDIQCGWPLSESQSINLLQSPEQHLSLHQQMQHRGVFRPGRLLVETFYPVGLLRAWTWLALDIEVLVYPRPLACELTVAVSADQHDDGEVIAVVGSDDFYQFKNYQPGDSLKHVFWKGYAKGQALQSKQFAAYREQRLWLDWANFDGDMETRLSKLCYWVLKLDKSDDEYGLRLPDLEIMPSHGESHRSEVLTALALYQSEELAP